MRSQQDRTGVCWWWSQLVAASCIIRTFKSSKTADAGGLTVRLRSVSWKEAIFQKFSEVFNSVTVTSTSVNLSHEVVIHHLDDLKGFSKYFGEYWVDELSSGRPLGISCVRFGSLELLPARIARTRTSFPWPLMTSKVGAESRMILFICISGISKTRYIKTMHSIFPRGSRLIRESTCKTQLLPPTAIHAYVM